MGFPSEQKNPEIGKKFGENGTAGGTTGENRVRDPYAEKTGRDKK